ncbi:hypothetical protein FRC05_007100 [Tulasnella sp. 425]|nr:hypothetical protein FRC05_007100 [Tulasnella sp. 425]
MGQTRSNPQYFDADHELSAPLRSTLKDVEHLFIRPQRLKIKEGNQVGVGGYGEVMLATLDKSREVAVKQLKVAVPKDDRKRLALYLARELRIWATLLHPNILGLLGYYLSRNYEIAQLISVYMVNGNVSQYVNQNQPDIATRRKFVQDITSGLQYLHAFNPPICHGDLKPLNVLISDELDAVLCDFGVASFIDQAAGPSGLTTTQAVKGSFRYMSPGLLLETEAKHTLPSDIWAWACTTYEIFTRIEPYSAVRSGPAVIAAMLRSNSPGSIQVLLSQLPPDEKWPTMLSEAINDCWNFDSSKRPSATTLIEVTKYPSNKLAGRSTELSLIPLRPPLSLSELRDGLLSTDDKASAKIEALDRTGRLSERTDIKAIGAYCNVFQAKLDNRLVGAFLS